MIRRPVNLIADLARLHPLQQSLAQHEHVQPPAEILLPAAEAVGEVGVVVGVGVQVAPDVDEFGCVGWWLWRLRERRERERLRREWLEKQEQLKQEDIEITYSYWDGSGHRKSVVVRSSLSR